MQDRHALALLQLAVQGAADIAAGRSVTRAEHARRLTALLEALARDAMLQDRTRRDRT